MKETLTLKEPVSIGEKLITEMEIRKPGTGEIRGLRIRLTHDGSAFGMDLTTDDLLTLVGRCTNLLPAEMNKVSLVDIYAAGKVMLNFMLSSPTIGKNG